MSVIKRDIRLKTIRFIDMRRRIKKEILGKAVKNVISFLAV